MAKVTSENLRAVLAVQVDSQAQPMIDEHPGYLKPGRLYKPHETLCHSREEYLRGDIYTNRAEEFFGNLKCGITGVYHHVGSQHLQQYLGGFDFHYNTRLDGDDERTVAGIGKAEGKLQMLLLQQGA